MLACRLTRRGDRRKSMKEIRTNPFASAWRGWQRAACAAGGSYSPLLQVATSLELPLDVRPYQDRLQDLILLCSLEQRDA